MDARTSKAKFHFLMAFGIICTIGLTLFFSALTFAVHSSLSWMHFPLAVCCAIAANYLAARFYFVGKDAVKVFARTTGIILLLFLFSLAVATYFYDISWDGQTYHQETVIQLKEGWNPFYADVPDTEFQSIWVNHYGKGAEIPQAAIYSLFNGIETGKATNLLLMFASFFLCTSFLYSMAGLSRFKVFLISSLLSLNPVVMNQLLTYYVDGFLSSLLLCLLTVCCYLFIGLDRIRLLLFGILILVTVNVKHTAVVFTTIFVAGLLILLLYQKRSTDLRKVLTVAVLASAIGVFFIGFNPYVTNIMHHRQPFFPVLGGQKLDVMAGQIPAGLSERNRFEKLFLSVFSSGAAPWPDRKPKLKVPFTLNRDEIHFSMLWDLRVAGFGPLFGGGVLLTATLLAVVLALNRRAKKLNNLCLYVLFVVLLSIFVISETWWARYVPQFWFLPLIVLAFSEVVKDRRLQPLRGILYVTLMVNVGIIFVVLLRYNLLATSEISQELAALKAANQVVIVDFGPFESHRIRYKENSIQYVVKYPK
jgi:hypothetical protein